MLEKNWNDLITPSNVVITAKDGDIKGTVVAEPIERGYGLTIGNSLRRVLLSSLQGAAITAVMAAPCKEDNKTLLKEFPIVNP